MPKIFEQTNITTTTTTSLLWNSCNNVTITDNIYGRKPAFGKKMLLVTANIGKFLFKVFNIREFHQMLEDIWNIFELKHKIFFSKLIKIPGLSWHVNIWHEGKNALFFYWIHRIFKGIEWVYLWHKNIAAENMFNFDESILETHSGASVDKTCKRTTQWYCYENEKKI